MFNMQVKNVRDGKHKISVVTTGAKFVFNKDTNKGEILCYQNLGKQRLLAKVTVSLSFKDLILEEKNDERVILHQSSPTAAFLKIRINGDSLLVFYSNNLIKSLTCSGNFRPEYNAAEGGNFLLIDQAGGIGLYPNLISWPDKIISNFSGDSWNITYPFNFQREIIISVFPPKPFNHKQAFESNIVHDISYHSPYPSNEKIKEWSKYGKILALFYAIWKGKFAKRGIDFDIGKKEERYLNTNWSSYHHIPVDEKKLLRVVNTAHKFKMKVIPYMSPFYSLAEGGEFQGEIKRVLEKYEFDGVYFDELLVGNNIEKAYKTVRNTRKLLGDKILYIHSTGTNRYLYCPFIDAYADYILRGEHFYPFDERYLRYVISGYNISNSIGNICSYDFPLSFQKKLIDHCLLANVQIPYWVPPASVSREYQNWSPSVAREYQKMMEEEYYPKLRKLNSGEKMSVVELKPLMNQDSTTTDKIEGINC